jgi:hypothetical protein
LPYDLFESDRHHASILKLRKRPARLDRFMLPAVANQEHAVGGTQPMEELVDLACGCQRRFIEYVETLRP